MSLAPKFATAFRTLCAVMAATFTSSCLDVDQKITLNPDGSGKFTTSSAVTIPDLGSLGGNEKSDPKKQARELVIALLRAEGVEAWSDVSYGVSKEGKTTVSVTGYFPDATKVKIAKPMSDDGEAESLGITKNEDGNWVFEQSLSDNMKSENDAPAPAEETLSDEEVQNRLDQERQQWAGAKMFMGAFLDGLRMAYSVEAGGTIIESSILKKDGDSKASFEFTGKQLLESMDKLLQDDDAAKALIKKGISPTDGNSSNSDEVFKNLFGSSDGTLRLVIKPGQPAFNYQEEVAKAKTNITPELKELLQEAAQSAEEDAKDEEKSPGVSDKID